MAIVVNPITRERPNELNQLALQIIAQKQAQNKINARDDINQAFLNADAELKDAWQSGKLLQMLQYDDTAPAAQAMVQNYMTARAAREGRRMTPEDLERETQTFLQKFSQNALLTPELTKAEERNHRPPTLSSPPTSSSASGSAASASSPSPNQPSSGSASTTGNGTTGFKISQYPIDDPNTGKNYGTDFVLETGQGEEILRGKSKDDIDRAYLAFQEASKTGNWDAVAQSHERALWGVDAEAAKKKVQERFSKLQASGYTPSLPNSEWENKAGMPPNSGVSDATPTPAQAQPTKTFRQWLVEQQNAGAAFTKEAGYTPVSATGKMSDEELQARNKGLAEMWRAGSTPPAGPSQAQRMAEISKKSKEIVMNLSSTGDEMPVRVPKIAQETAKELQGKGAEYDTLKSEGGLLARMKARKLEAQAAKVWKATKMSPEFKRISQDEYKYWDKWAKEATPEQLAISGMEEVAKIKNDAERIRVTKMLGQAELEYSYLKAAASAGNDAAAITLKQIDANVEIVKGMLSATKGDEKAFNKLLTNESFNSAVKAIGALNGVKPEDMFNFVKTWTGGVKAIPQDPAEWNNPFGALRQGLQAQPATSAATTYIQAQTQGR